jgi:hypothetical protein
LYPALQIDFNRATIKVQLEGEDEIVGIGDAVNKTESEKLAALSVLHQLNTLGKVSHFSYYHAS